MSINILISRGEVMEKRKKAFTFIEIMIVVAILSILLLMVTPSFVQSRAYHQRNLVNTTNKILISAIDYWIKDNFDPSQRPSDFNSRNSQGKAVFEYISNREILSFRDSNNNITGRSNLWIDGNILRTNAPLTDGMLDINFQRGILTIGYFDGTSVRKEERRYRVYPIAKGSNGNELTEEQSYDSWKARNFIIESNI